MTALLAQTNGSEEAVWIGIATGILSYVFSIGGFLLAIVLIARLMREKRQPSTTLSWLLVIVLIPHIGVPLYLLIGGRKLRRLASNKRQLYPPKIPGNPVSFEGWENGHPLFRAASMPPSAGNQLNFLLNGEQAFELLEQEIRNTQETIHIMVFILGNDEVGRRIVELLAEKAREGVKVRLLLDALGSLKTRNFFLDPLHRAGGETARFMPMLRLPIRWSANLRNHRKIAIFDNKIALVGGHNFAAEYMGPEPHPDRFQDFGARIAGPAVHELAEIFTADWNFATRKRNDPLPDPKPAPRLTTGDSGLVQVVASGPDVPRDSLYEAILLLVQEAREEIAIVTPYFIPDEVLFRSLLLKLHSGKKVSIVVPHRSNHPLTDYARAHYLRELKAAGARILAYLPGMIHAKLIVVDGKAAMFGSANIDLRSLFVNYEVGIFCYSRCDVTSICEWYEKMTAASEPFEANRKKPRFIRTLTEDISRLLAPLM